MSARAVAALGATQIVGYGTLYYAFPIAVPALAASHDVSQTWLYGVFSAGMLAGGLIAPAVGRTMDRIGAPRVMAAGSVIAAVLLALLPLAPDAWTLSALILALEMSAVAVLYDGAFATLALLRGAGARRAITQLTLIAGFASTVFWPLSGWLIEGVGWQATYAAFAALHLFVALPLHLWLARQRPAVRAAAEGATHAEPKAGAAAAGVAADGARAAFSLLALTFALKGMVIAAIGVHMLPLLQATGLGTVSYMVAMLMGPSQVAIRATDALFWKGLHPIRVALISTAALPLAVLTLLLAGSLGAGQIAATVVFAMLFGVGQGLSSIVNGTLPLAMFGPAGFGAMLGRLAAVRSVLSAIAPFLFALLMARAGAGAAMVVAVALGTLSLVPLLLLQRMLGPNGAPR